MELYYKDGPREAGLDMGFLLKGYNPEAREPAPRTVPGIVNHKEIQIRGTKEGEKCTYYSFPLVWGGVNMEMDVSEQSFEHDSDLKRVREAIIEARPSSESLSWSFTLH